MTPIEIARETFVEAWKQIWAEAAMLLIAIFVLLGFCAIVWIYLEYISMKSKR